MRELGTNRDTFRKLKNVPLRPSRSARHHVKVMMLSGVYMIMENVSDTVQ